MQIRGETKRITKCLRNAKTPPTKSTARLSTTFASWSPPTDEGGAGVIETELLMFAVGTCGILCVHSKTVFVCVCVPSGCKSGWGEKEIRGFDLATLQLDNHLLRQAEDAAALLHQIKNNKTRGRVAPPPNEEQQRNRRVVLILYNSHCETWSPRAAHWSAL